MDPGRCTIPSSASSEQGISTQCQWAEDQGISQGDNCEGITTQDAHKMLV